MPPSTVSEDARWGATAIRLLKWSAARRKGCGPPWPDEQTIELLQKRRIDSLLYLASDAHHPPQAVYDRYWARQRHHHLELLRELEARGISTITFKGAELVARSFDGHSLGFLADVDILVDPADLHEVKRTCDGFGWRQSQLDSESRTLCELDLLEIARIEIDHYELVPYRWSEDMAFATDEEQFVRAWSRPPLWPAAQARASAFFKLDIHWRPVFDIEAGELFKRAVPSSLGVGLTLSDADHLWLVLAKLYKEVAMLGKRYLRDFAYIAPLIHDGSVDWDVVLAAHREYALGAGLYYYLFFLNEITEGAVPEPVLSALDPRRHSRMRDWGWQLSPLLDGLDAMPACAQVRL